MKIIKAEHEITAVKPEQYPEATLPEIAFVGRSNVGKSSMINSLCNRKKIARVGQTPGKTRVINFYNVNDTLRLVDLPGYGYAKASKSLQQTWNKFTDNYLSKREAIVLIVHLIDIRHDPSKTDINMVNWLRDSGKPYVICAVKSDKLAKQRAFESATNIVRTLHLEQDIPFVLYSSPKKQGIEELWEAIEFYALDNEDE